MNGIYNDVIFRRTLFKISRFLLKSVNATEVRHQQYRQQNKVKITTAMMMMMISPHACDDIWRRAQQALSILLGRWRYEKDQKCLQVACRFDVSFIIACGETCVGAEPREVSIGVHCTQKIFLDISLPQKKYT